VALSQHGMVAPVTIHHRVDFAASMVDGRTVGEAVPSSASSKEIAELWVYIQDRLARLTKDATLTPEILPDRFSLAPLSGLDAAEIREAPEPSEVPAMVHSGPSAQIVEKPQFVQAAQPAEPTQFAEQAQIVETHQTDAMTYGGGVARRAGMERRDAPRGSALFTSPERRTGVFGRRHLENYETGRGK